MPAIHWLPTRPLPLQQQNNVPERELHPLYLLIKSQQSQMLSGAQVNGIVYPFLSSLPNIFDEKEQGCQGTIAER